MRTVNVAKTIKDTLVVKGYKENDAAEIATKVAAFVMQSEIKTFRIAAAQDVIHGINNVITELKAEEGV